MPPAHIVKFNLRVILRFISVLSSRIQFFFIMSGRECKQFNVYLQVFLERRLKQTSQKKRIVLADSLKSVTMN